MQRLKAIRLRPASSVRLTPLLVTLICLLVILGSPVPATTLNLSAAGKLDEFEVASRLGVELLDAPTVGLQPVQWYGTRAEWPVEPGPRRLVLPGNLKQLTGATLETTGTQVQLRLPPAEIRAVRREKQAKGERLVIELDRPVFYQVTPIPGGVRLSVQSRPGAGLKLEAGVQVAATPEQMVIEASGPGSSFYTVTTLAGPPRLVVEWQIEGEGSRLQALNAFLSYREWQLVWEGRPRRVHVLTFVLAQVRLGILSTQGRTTGPLSAMAELAGAWGAVNGSFFNRNTQEALGALRSLGAWWSGPVPGIPARGAVAWSDLALAFDRLHWQGTVRGRFDLPVGTFNSSLTGPGLAAYSRAWGSYVPRAGERLALLQDRKLRAVLSPKTPIAIPEDGLLLAAREEPASSRFGELAESGAVLDLEIAIDPPSLRQPSLLAAGPLLVKDGRVVLDADLERFRPDVQADGVARTVIARTAESGMLIVVERGPQAEGMSLTALTRLITTRLSVQDALNLDGGGSSAFYLSGHLRDRPEGNFERSVHNGLGLWPRL